MQRKTHFLGILISLLIHNCRCYSGNTYPRLSFEENNSGKFSNIFKDHRGQTSDLQVEKITTKLDIKDLDYLSFRCLHKKPIKWIFECPRTHSGPPLFETQESLNTLQNGDVEYQADFAFSMGIFLSAETNFSCSEFENRSSSILFLKRVDTMDKTNKLSFYFQNKMVNSTCHELTSIEATIPDCPVYINFDNKTKTYECSNSSWKSGFFDCRNSLGYCLSLRNQDRLNRKCLREDNFGKELGSALDHSGVIECSLESNGERIANVFALVLSIPDDDTAEYNLYTSLEKVKLDPNILVLSRVTESHEFFIGEMEIFHCSGFGMIFAKGFRWLAKYTNGTVINHGLGVWRDTVPSIDYDVFRERKLFFIESNMSEIQCAGFIPSLNEWKTTTYELTLVEYTSPNVISFTVWEKDHIVYAKCKAGGYPEPATAIKICNVTLEVYNEPQLISCEQMNPEAEFGGYVIIPNKLVIGKTHAVCMAYNWVGNASKLFALSQRIGQADAVDGIAEKNNLLINTSLWAVGVVFVVGLIITIGVLVVKLRERRSRVISLESELQSFFEGIKQKTEDINDPVQNLFGTAYNKRFEISRESIELHADVLGSGQFGIVVKGTYNGHTVAVKTLRDSSDILYLKGLLAEIKILIFVGQHKNIVNLIGAYTEKVTKLKVLMVMDYCENGCLLTFLRSRRTFFMNVFDRTQDSSKKKEQKSTYAISTMDLTRFSCEVADAMAFIAEKNIMHGDIAARNVLVTGDISMKLCDFGLAKQMSDYQIYVQKKQIPMPVKWMALESLSDLKFSIESDAWSFGILLWEIFSLGEAPYPGIEWGFDSWRILETGYRMGKPKYSNDEIYYLMKQCWLSDPKQRPEFRDILEILQHAAAGNGESPQPERYVKLQE